MNVCDYQDPGPSKCFQPFFFYPVHRFFLLSTYVAFGEVSMYPVGSHIHEVFDFPHSVPLDVQRSAHASFIHSHLFIQQLFTKYCIDFRLYILGW